MEGSSALAGLVEIVRLEVGWNRRGDREKKQSIHVVICALHVQFN